MADDKTKTDQRDRAKVAGGEDYEVQYLSEKSGIAPPQARELSGATAMTARYLRNALPNYPSDPADHAVRFFQRACHLGPLFQPIAADLALIRKRTASRAERGGSRNLSGRNYMNALGFLP